MTKEIQRAHGKQKICPHGGKDIHVPPEKSSSTTHYNYLDNEQGLGYKLTNLNLLTFKNFYAFKETNNSYHNSSGRLNTDYLPIQSSIDSKDQNYSRPQRHSKENYRNLSDLSEF